MTASTENPTAANAEPLLLPVGTAKHGVHPPFNHVFCKDCVHHRAESVFQTRSAPKVMICRHEQVRTGDLVYGYQARHCYAERCDSFGLCGREGKLFAPLTAEA